MFVYMSYALGAAVRSAAVINFGAVSIGLIHLIGLLACWFKI